jgi:hypothetical protein
MTKALDGIQRLNNLKLLDVLPFLSRTKLPIMLALAVFQKTGFKPLQCTENFQRFSIFCQVNSGE